MEEFNKNFKLKKSFAKTYYNFYKKEPKLNFYLSFLSLEHILYVSSFYFFFEIVKLKDKKWNLKLEEMFKYNSYDTVNMNHISIEFISVLYLFKKFNIKYKSIEKIIYNIDNFEDENDLIEYLNNYENFFRDFLKYIFEIELKNLPKLFILQNIILNIKHDFLEDKIYIPKYYHTKLKYDNRIYKKNIKTFKIKEYLDYLINKKGNLFNLSIEPIFNNIIFNLIILYFNYFYDVLINLGNIKKEYQIYISKYLLINRNVIQNIILEPLMIINENYKMNITLFNLGVILYLKLCLNYYYYKFKIKFI